MTLINSTLRAIQGLLGIEQNSTSHWEKIISAQGALCGILAIYWASQWYLDTQGMLLMVASMGASAVLLFAVPHGALSQPWPVIGGHLISAFIGVSCQRWLPEHTFTPALAVGLAVGAMHYLRCIHPPGGATALSAVIGGPAIHALGYHYLITPILINLLAILAVAIAFNGLFPWRRYPAHLVQRNHRARQPDVHAASLLTLEDMSAALQQLNSFIDVTPEDLVEIFTLAQAHAADSALKPIDIRLGASYSNGQLGAGWSVRQVIDAQQQRRSKQDLVIYKVIAGANLYSTGVCRRDEFCQWARFEVIQHQGLWVRAPMASEADQVKDLANPHPASPVTL